MVLTPLMSKARWLAFASLTLSLCAVSLSACGSGEDRPGSLVGSAGAAGHSGGHGGQLGEGGQSTDDGGNQSAGGDNAGAAGEGSLTAAPLAIFPQQLEVDVGCGADTEPSELVIRNGGLLPLTISSATASAGYVVDTELPLQIATGMSAELQVTPPAAKATASVGDKSSGVLTFVTDEADGTSHEVQLNTTLFGGQFQFTDGSDNPLRAGLPLTYLSSDSCPDNVRYRVRNTGNLAFTLFGPTFPIHLGGTSTGANGQSVPPDGYIELQVGGNSGSDGACSANGELIFTVQGSLCGSVPKLSVTWPTHIQTTGCECTTGTE